ncbi:HD domain-containing protein [Patescibacteria group bacterium]|nr:HD domain-containing protein [Patescibacteria group bacterium]
MSNRKEIISLIIDYQRQNPPTSGHGFSHLIKVANHCQKLAKLNKYEDPNLAYIVGLFHDIYRPATGGGQEEHESSSASITKTILNGILNQEEINTVVNAIDNHDQRIIDGNSNLLDNIISIADKSTISFQRGIAYTWACNQGPKVIYKNYIEVVRDFLIYQNKAWIIFGKSKIIGVDHAIKAYLATDTRLIQALRLEMNHKTTYPKDSLIWVKKEITEDKKYLKRYLTSDLC